MSEATVTVTQDNFEAAILQSEVPVLVDFWAPWCAPCRALAPTLDELATENAGKATVAKINVDDFPELAAKFGVMNIPTLVFFSGGEEVDRTVGVKTKQELADKIQSLTA